MPSVGLPDRKYGGANSQDDGQSSLPVHEEEREEVGL